MKAKSPVLPTRQQLAILSKKASEVIQRLLSDPFQLNVSIKSQEMGIVTQADIASEQAIVSAIKELDPSCVILAEENHNFLLSRHSDQAVWVIDPIDGTTNFSKSNDYYCISISMCLFNQEGILVPQAASIYQPSTERFYSAIKSEGTTCNETPVRVRNSCPLELASVATGFAGAKGKKLKQITDTIYRFQNQILGLRINGAAALDLAHVAKGVFEGFYESGLQPWDLAAGILLVEEAGGVAIQFDGSPAQVLGDGTVIAGSKAFVEQIRPIINAID